MSKAKTKPTFKVRPPAVAPALPRPPAPLEGAGVDAFVRNGVTDEAPPATESNPTTQNPSDLEPQVASSSATQVISDLKPQRPEVSVTQVTDNLTISEPEPTQTEVSPPAPAPPPRAIPDLVPASDPDPRRGGGSSTQVTEAPSAQVPGDSVTQIASSSATPQPSRKGQGRGGRAKTTERKPTGRGLVERADGGQKRRHVVYFDPALSKRLAILAVEEGSTISDLVEDAVAKMLGRAR